MSPHLHFMGIGGVSMSGLARHYRAAGNTVSGCDSVDSQALAALRAEGIAVCVGHDESHLQGVDLLVSSMAVSGHPEAAAAARLGIRSIKRIELLAELFERHEAVAVTGTHGKSTTTGMLATIFVRAGRDPSVQLGADLPLLGGNMRFGHGRTLVAEVDESDPGFAGLRSDIAVLTNLEDDHIAGEYSERRNYHASLADLEAAAQAFARNARQVVACADWPSLEPLLAGIPGIVRYGAARDADYRIVDLRLRDHGSSFSLQAPAGREIEVSLAVPGRHNAQNAAGALAAADLAGLPLVEAARSLSDFGGVGRRWQRWGEPGGALVIDDYAHHPTEVAATLQAARHTGRRVRAVLQPHRWVRTARHWPALAEAAALAHEVVVLDIYGAGEAAIPGVSPQLIVERLGELGVEASHRDLDSALVYLRDSLSPGDLVITLGAGDVWKVAAALARTEAASARA